MADARWVDEEPVRCPECGDELRELYVAYGPKRRVACVHFACQGCRRGWSLVQEQGGSPKSGAPRKGKS